MRAFFSFLYGLAAYAASLAALLYLMGFTANWRVPTSVDVGTAAPWGQAVVIDLLLLAVYFRRSVDVALLRTDRAAVPDHLIQFDERLVLVFVQRWDIDAGNRHRNLGYVGLVSRFGREGKLRQVSLVRIAQAVLFGLLDQPVSAYQRIIRPGLSVVAFPNP